MTDETREPGEPDVYYDVHQSSDAAPRVRAFRVAKVIKRGYFPDLHWIERIDSPGSGEWLARAEIAKHFRPTPLAAVGAHLDDLRKQVARARNRADAALRDLARREKELAAAKALHESLGPPKSGDATA
jgi:hypothetical protein